MGKEHDRGTIQSIPLNQLVIDTTERRPCDPAKVEALAESMREVGLLQPIGVLMRPGSQFGLVYGRHRVAAAQRLRWPRLLAIVLDCDAAQAELAEIDENLIRAPLTAIDEAKAMARRKVLYEAMHPETKRGAKGGRKAKPGTAKPAELDAKLAGNSAAPFVADTAAKTGRSERSIARAAQLGAEIPDDLLPLIARSAIKDHQQELQRFARLCKQDPGQAATVARMLADGEVKTVGEALAEPGSRPVDEPAPVRKPRKQKPGLGTPNQVSDEDQGEPVVDGTDSAEGAAAHLKAKLIDLVRRWVEAWGDHATSVLACAVLEGYAAELRDELVGR